MSDSLNHSPSQTWYSEHEWPEIRKTSKRRNEQDARYRPTQTFWRPSLVAGSTQQGFTTSFTAPATFSFNLRSAPITLRTQNASKLLKIGIEDVQVDGRAVEAERYQ